MCRRWRWRGLGKGGVERENSLTLMMHGNDFYTAAKIFDICSEQEGEPNRMILREIVLMRLRRGLIVSPQPVGKKIFRNA